LKICVSLGEILVIGSALCAVLLALGITFGNVDVVEGGVIIVSLCGGLIIVRVLKASKSKSRRKV